MAKPSDIAKVDWVADYLGRIMDELRLSDRVGGDTLMSLVFRLALKLDQVGHPLDEIELGVMFDQALHTAIGVHFRNEAK